MRTLKHILGALTLVGFTLLLLGLDVLLAWGMKNELSRRTSQEIGDVIASPGVMSGVISAVFMFMGMHVLVAVFWLQAVPVGSARRFGLMVKQTDQTLRVRPLWLAPVTVTASAAWVMFMAFSWLHHWRQPSLEVACVLGFAAIGCVALAARWAARSARARELEIDVSRGVVRLPRHPPRQPRLEIPASDVLSLELRPSASAGHRLWLQWREHGASRSRRVITAIVRAEQAERLVELLRQSLDAARVADPRGPLYASRPST